MTTLEQLTELNTLNECALECTKQSRWKGTTQRYIADMLSKNINLRNDVLSGNYAVKPTIDFSISERGRIRKIEAPVIRDRVLQKSMMKNVLTPNIRPYLIYDNYASLKLRGTSFARKRFDIMLRRYMAHNGTEGYILLFDFKSFFELIDHDVLKQLLAQKLKNEPDDVVALIHYMIDTSSKTDKGLNLGGEPPQIFAVFYPTLIDIFVKVVLGIKYYGRYMDDGFVIAKTKEELVDILCKIEEKLSKLKLIINRKKTHIVKLKHGFTFLQIKYNITPTGKILKRPTHSKITRERRRLKAFKRMYDNGKMTIEEIDNCYKSWRGTFIKEHNAYRKTLASMDALFKALFPIEIIKTQISRNVLVRQANKEVSTEDLKYIGRNINLP